MVTITNNSIYIDGRKTRFGISDMSSLIANEDGVYFNGELIDEDDYEDDGGE